jgi:hypothetical protein
MRQTCTHSRPCTVIHFALLCQLPPAPPLTQFFALKGPSGTYSHFCMSRALQSFSSTSPNTWSAADSMGTGSPMGLPGPMKAPCMNANMHEQQRPHGGPYYAVATSLRRVHHHLRCCPSSTLFFHSLTTSSSKSTAPLVLNTGC